MEPENEFSVEINALNKKLYQVVCIAKRIEIKRDIKQPAVAIYFAPISDEPPLIKANEDICYRTTIDNKSYYYCYDDLILKIFNTTRAAHSPLEERASYIEQVVRNKVFILTPKYELNEKGIISKKLNIRAIASVSCYYDSSTFDFNSYFLLPSISAEKANELKAGKTITLEDWSNDYFGLPHYLDVGDKLLKVDLEGVDDKRVKLADDSLVEGKFISDQLEKIGGLLISYRKNRRFFAKESVINVFASSKQVVQVKQPEETPVIKAEPKPVSKEESILNNLLKYLKSVHLEYSNNDIYNFHSCMKSGVLTILAGMSGTGKTRLPLEYAHFFGLKEEDKTFLFLPIYPSYTDPSDLLGYYSPTDHSFHPSDTGFTDILVHAANHPEQIHLVLFEEMNLAQVEHWFAPFLAVLEKDADERYLRLYSLPEEDSSRYCTNQKEYPSLIKLGSNLIFIGTINVDETTTRMSDRLIDRSFIIHLSKGKFSTAKKSMTVSDKTDIALSDASELKELLGDRNFLEFDYLNSYSDREIDFFDELNDLLSRKDAHFGVSYREVKNIAIYLKCTIKTNGFTKDVAFDYAFKQTILEKIRGEGDGLRELFGYGVKEGELESLLKKYADISSFALTFKGIADKRKELENYDFLR